jgi:hypothetical protein
VKAKNNGALTNENEKKNENWKSLFM